LSFWQSLRKKGLRAYKFFDNSSIYEKTNMLMNFLSLISILLKVIYEQGFKATNFEVTSGFVDFNSWLRFFFICQLLHVFVASMSSISFMKQLISWIPNQFR